MLEASLLVVDNRNPFILVILIVGILGLSGDSGGIGDWIVDSDEIEIIS